MLWAASATDSYAQPLAEIMAAQRESGIQLVAAPSLAPIVPALQDSDEAIAACAREVNAHIAANALNDLAIFNAQGASSPLRKDPTIAGLQYLKGLAVHLERVYGGATLAAIMRQMPRVAELPPVVSSLPNPLPGAVEIPVAPTPPLQASGLLEAAAAQKNPFPDGQSKLPFWLGGALSQPGVKLTVPALVAREPGGLKAHERATCWLLVPQSATALRIEWKTLDSQLPLMVEGGWKSLPLPATIAPATHGIRIETTGRPGWQKFAFTAPADLTFVASWFEKAAK